MAPRGCLAVTQVPREFVEPGIVGGYRRPGQSWAYYARSAAWLHNESLNIWTHGVATAALVAVLVWEYGHELSPADPYHWAFLVGYSSCCGMFVCSTAAHLLHSKSRLAHQVFFMVDYAGIGLFGVGTSLPHLYYIAEEEFFAASRFHLPAMVALAVLSCSVGSYYKVQERPGMRRSIQSLTITAMYCWSMWPVASRYAPCLSGDTARCSQDPIFWTHCYQFISLLLAGFFYGSHVPERLWRGRFDVWGQSHTIFHIFIYLNMYFGALAAFRHLQRMPVGLRASRIPGSLLEIATPPVLVALLEALLIAVMALRSPLYKQSRKAFAKRA